MFKHSHVILAIFASVNMHACSIVGYVGCTPAKLLVLAALARLEYRGYDSAGFACLNPKNGRLVCIRATGKLQNLVNKLDRDPIDSTIAVGHTRWATHGAPSEENAHPHVDCLNSLAVVHNGIIENYYALKEQLIARQHIFLSHTDTEVIAHVFEESLKEHTDLVVAAQHALSKLVGAYGLVMVTQRVPDALLVARKGSPICVGRGHGCMVVASDVLAFDENVREVCYIPDASFALVKRDSLTLFNLTGKALEATWQPFSARSSVHQKMGYAHFMLKEIYEQPEAIKTTVHFYRSLKDRLLTHLNFDEQLFKKIREIVVVACGTSWHAGRIGQFFFESIAQVPTHVHLASEFRYAPFIPRRNTLYVLISQSGETADTLEALRLINQRQLPTLTITNVVSSTMARETRGCLATFAGPEVAVASTKAFTAQITALYWLAHIIAEHKGLITDGNVVRAENELLQVAESLKHVIVEHDKVLAQLVDKTYARYTKFFFLGRHVGYPFAMEAALKLKEISYVFAMGYPAGELKHGSIALIDDQMPVIMFSSLDPVVYAKLVSNAQEVKARGGRLCAFVFAGQSELARVADDVICLPSTAPLLEPLIMSGPMQLFAYHMARNLRRDIDKPRNLAKSVTVE